MLCRILLQTATCTATATLDDKVENQSVCRYQLLKSLVRLVDDLENVVRSK